MKKKPISLMIGVIVFIGILAMTFDSMPRLVSFILFTVAGLASFAAWYFFYTPRNHT